MQRMKSILKEDVLLYTDSPRFRNTINSLEMS